MSRVANNPISIPTGAQITLTDNQLTAKGPKGSLSIDVHASVLVNQDNDQITVKVKGGLADDQRKFAGTMRALINNNIIGVTDGFERKLLLEGTGYRAQVQGQELNLTLGFSHPVVYIAPEGITLETPSQKEVVVKGIDKQKVGQVASEIRAYRPPEPYKGKGVRYADERVERKEVKKK